MKKKETLMKAILIVIIRKTDEAKLWKTGGGESKAEKKFSPAGGGQTETANKNRNNKQPWSRLNIKAGLINNLYM